MVSIDLEEDQRMDNMAYGLDDPNRINYITTHGTITRRAMNTMIHIGNEYNVLSPT
jgi:hypothetical protein